MNVLNVRIENFIIVDIISINYKTMKNISTFRNKINIKSTNNINKIFTRTFEKHIKKSKSAEDLKIPYVPFFCPITKKSEMTKGYVIY